MQKIILKEHYKKGKQKLETKSQNIFLDYLCFFLPHGVLCNYPTYIQTKFQPSL